MKAIIAVAASMVNAAYHILRDGVPNNELTGTYFDSRDRTKLAKRLVRRLSDLGLQVELRTAT